MTTEIRPNLYHIHDLIVAAETRQGHRMRADDKEFLTKSVASFMTKFIDKFVAGCHQHNANNETNFADNVDHNREIEQEILDLWAYTQGNKCKQKQN